ncbi:MAG: iron ABC transporter permease [Peptococcaceae bacterium]|jgi:iron complex transport system permease protein|nr:iron ABC transporter permease [Peptococcaceae bacterium]
MRSLISRGQGEAAPSLVKSLVPVVAALLALNIVSLVIAVSVGQVAIPAELSYKILLYRLTGAVVGDKGALTAGTFMNIVWDIRFPRALTSMLVGAGLAVCGVIMQASVKNPLADPYILGVSSGASLGATFAILIGFGSLDLLSQAGVSFGAFTGALIASLGVLTLAETSGRATSTKLVLSGMVINALCNAFSNFIVYFASDSEGIKSVTFWTMGSLASAKWEKLPLLAAVVGAALLFSLPQARVLNIMLIGDEAAITLGIRLSSYRRGYMIVSALVTGVIVSYCGMIGFVGLIVPHIARGFVGSDHRRVIPISMGIGSLFLVWADVIARVAIPKSEVPIGIITAMIGAPVFIYMLVKRGYGFGKE